jgi:hypothetical protein
MFFVSVIDEPLVENKLVTKKTKIVMFAFFNNVIRANMVLLANQLAAHETWLQLITLSIV